MNDLLRLAIGLAVGFAALNEARANLLTNGDFETGTFAGWTVTDLTGGSGSFFIDAPGTTTPVLSFPTVGSAANGLFYAVTDQAGPGTHALTQSFTVLPGSTVTLAFDMFVNDQSGAGPIIDPSGLDHTGPPNQHARVDILTASATPFDTGAGVVTNLFIGVDPSLNPHPFTPYLFDISPFVGFGGTFQVRFAAVENVFFLNMGVDNVSIVAESAMVPEPSTFALLSIGALALAGYGFRSKRRNRRQPRAA